MDGINWHAWVYPAALGLMAALVIQGVGRKIFYEGWQRGIASRSRARYLTQSMAWFKRLLVFTRSDTRGLLVKDVRLFLAEAEAFGIPIEVAQAVGRLWEKALAEFGAESDFTELAKTVEHGAGIEMRAKKKS